MQIISKSCNFSSETKITALGLAWKSDFLKIRTPLVKPLKIQKSARGPAIWDIHVGYTSIREVYLL